ncbi:MAG TPA: hypothetical protein VHP34_00105 [Alphaproteobacteria bacterium]|nr:hypothetical protein [Alphaproteobacteria bacterium]
MKKKFLPSISPTDYARMVAYCRDLPDSFDAWLQQEAQGKKRYQSLGYQTISVLISAEELKNYCKAMRFAPSASVLSMYATAKYLQAQRTQNNGRR